MSTPLFTTPDEIRDARPDLSVETIRRHCRLGRIAGAVKVGASWAIPVDAAEEYVKGYERHTQTRTPAPPQAPASVPPGTEE